VPSFQLLERKRRWEYRAPWRINFAWVITASFTSTSTYQWPGAGDAVIKVGAATE
jgi:hypothetical protein